MPQEAGKQYKQMLENYLRSQGEEDLYLGQQFSRSFIEKNIAPEDVISIHKTSIEELIDDLPADVGVSFDFLIEMMIHYGLALKEHQSLIRKQEAIQTEMDIAVRVQNTLLQTAAPVVEGLEIGWVSRPAKQMNGDYVYFLNDTTHEVCLAVADIIGKGISAAMHMSMVKFGMDSMRYEKRSPSEVLRIINKMVEKSVADSMFISMFYGKYDTDNEIFRYSSAGHEPAIFYRAAADEFSLLESKGLLLGVQEEAEYEERTVHLNNGDFIAIMTDGVTETRTEKGFIELDVIEKLLRDVRSESAQAMVDYLFNELSKMQNYQLHDDFTLVILKKTK
ncbi:MULTISPECIES: PP2C family protein-serine/threonine phosphatase [unclassified Sporosarcina]|uniref:PP2C family protein-serine/threonine phosphatase n=1 Tax=unclassified Sporosarcina TaxID=2647733 RepID=UPI0018DB59E2|nr:MULTISPECIES: PP2C family protein-serine/threonine phosphatase [unclassified Sporosarcina]